MKFYYASLLMFICSVMAHAEETNFRCNATQNTYANNLTCLKDVYQYNNQKLDAAYQNTLENLSSDKKKQLKKQQKIWKKSRNRDCNKLTNVEKFGEESQLMTLQCKIQKTKARINVVKNYK